MIAFSISASSVFLGLVLVRLFRERSRQSLPRLTEWPTSDPKPRVKLLSDGSELSAAIERAMGFEEHAAQSVRERLDRYSLVVSKPENVPLVLVSVPDELADSKVSLVSESKRQKEEVAFPKRPMTLKMLSAGDPEPASRTGPVFSPRL